MKRILLTGASGFVGANLTRSLIAHGHEVHLLVRPEFARWRLEGVLDQVQLHDESLADPEGLSRRMVAVQPECVFHLAVYGAYSQQDDLARMVRTNIVGTMNLVNACLEAGVEVMVNTGSSSEYGFKAHPPSETDWIDPNSHYAVTKASATLFCRFTARKHHVRIPTLRLYSAYGPYEEPGRLIPALIMRGLRKELPPLVSPDIARDYVYIDDVVQAYLRAASLESGDPGVVYNVGTGIQTRLTELVGIARRSMAIEAEPVWGTMPNRSWDTSTWVADNARIRTEIGWEPQFDLESGLRATLQWFAAHPEMLSYYEKNSSTTSHQ